MKIIVNGCTGRMGQMIISLIEKGYGEHSVAAGCDPCCPSGQLPDRYASLAEFTGEAECVVDFSHHAATKELLAYCVERKLPVVIATTGHTPEEKAMIEAAAKEIPIFFSYNMSVGIAVLASLAKQTASMFPDADIEIIEKHHNQKLDVPSGTAILLANAITEAKPDSEILVGRHENGKRSRQEIGIHSLRYGSEVGTHEIIISTGSQTLTLKHEAENRALFGEGALTAANFLKGKGPGLYNMNDMIK